MKVFAQITAFVLALALVFVSCTNQDKTEEKEQPVEPTVNYEETSNWLALPEVIDREVDCFYVYPTVSNSETGSMDINSESERLLAQGIYEAQATVYEDDTNMFAPYYRQMSTGVKMPEDNPDFLATDTEEFKQGAKDVEAAFNYYIDNLNEGRPFIIAGHSQGTMALIELIKNRFGADPELRERMVAAYFIGYTVTDEELEEAGLTFAQGETDTGVLIAYNTQSPTSVGGPMLMEGANCINPLNWKTDDTMAVKEDNFGARFYVDSTGEFIREVPMYCSAQINTETGGLMVEIPEGEELDIGPYPEGVYHRFDYAFFYRNLQKNVRDRIQAYLNK